MRRLTRPWTMRRLWCDASVAASEVGVESGTWTSKLQNQVHGASGGKRARQVLLREGRRQEPHEVNVKISSSIICSAWPLAVGAQAHAAATPGN